MMKNFIFRLIWNEKSEPNSLVSFTVREGSYPRGPCVPLQLKALTKRASMALQKFASDAS